MPSKGIDPRFAPAIRATRNQPWQYTRRRYFVSTAHFTSSLHGTPEVGAGEVHARILLQVVDVAGLHQMPVGIHAKVHILVLVVQCKVVDIVCTYTTESSLSP